MNHAVCPDGNRLASLGGEEGKIERLPFLTDAIPVADLVEVDGQRLDAIIGNRTMEQWKIRLDPSTGELDLEGLRRREFKEW